MKTKSLAIVAMLVLTGCQTIGQPTPAAITPPLLTNTAGISGGGLIGGAFGSALSQTDRQAALDAEYKALEYAKGSEPVDWSGQGGTISGRIKAAQPYRVGSQDCRQFSHELMNKGVASMARGTACRNTDGSWSLLE